MLIMQTLLDPNHEISIKLADQKSPDLIAFAIDSPVNGVMTNGSDFLLQGWVLGKESPSVGLRLVECDGKTLMTFPINQARLDVVRIYLNHSDKLCGFSERVNIASARPISIEAVLENGDSVWIGTIELLKSDNFKPLGRDHLSVRAAISHQYIQGDGIEIGALHSPLSVPSNAHVKYVDRGSVESLRAQYPELNQVALVEVDIIDDGERLENIPDNSQDFVIANHFLEHCQNPILTIQNMLRVLHQGGILYMAVPDKRYTFDALRPVTDLEHLLKEYHTGTSWSEKQHYEEWVKYVDKVEEVAEIKEQAKYLLNKQYSIHFHVWTPEALQELILILKIQLNFKFEITVFIQNFEEMIFILTKI